MEGLISQKVERSELKEGDHIYSWRKLYSHHGIFIGEGKVIHFENQRNHEGGSSLLAAFGSSAGGGGKRQKTPCPTPDCGLEKAPKSGVKLSCIDCFVKKGSLYLFKYEASQAFLLASVTGGTCTTAKSDPPEEVIYRATYLHENGYGKYDLMNNNCEDFSLYCKTGLLSTDINYQGRSSQANMVHKTTRVGNGAGKVNKIKRVATALPRSFSKRQDKDLGIREDTVRVPVEELSSYIQSLQESAKLQNHVSQVK